MKRKAIVFLIFAFLILYCGLSHQVALADTAPRLDWAGSAASNLAAPDSFLFDGVSPNIGENTDKFTFCIEYTSGYGYEPAIKEVWIDWDGNPSTYEKKYGLNTFNNDPVTQGRIYFREDIEIPALNLAENEDRVIYYRFNFIDIYGNIATGDPADDEENHFLIRQSETPAPTNPPSLKWYGTAEYLSDGVGPNSGTGGRIFTFKIIYRDNELKERPSVAQVWIDLDDNGEYYSNEKYTMDLIIEDSDPDNIEYSYRLDKRLYLPQTGDSEYIDYSFVFKNFYSNAYAVGPDLDENYFKFDDNGNIEEILEEHGYLRITGWGNIPEVKWPGGDPDKSYNLDPNGGAYDYIFSVIYEDEDDKAPEISEVWIDLDDNGEYDPSEQFPMTQDSADDTDYDADEDGVGVSYSSYTISFDPNKSGEDYYYRFFFRDEFNMASGEPAGAFDHDFYKDPIFTLTNNAPSITWATDFIHKTEIDGGTTVNFKIKYSDEENDPPSIAQIWIYGYGDPNNIQKIDMTAVNDEDTNYKDGKEYYVKENRKKTFYYYGINPNEDDEIEYKYYFKDKYNNVTQESTKHSMEIKQIGNIPELIWYGSWTEDPNSPYFEDGANPDSIEANKGTFVFEIIYKDNDADYYNPGVSQIWIDANMNGLYDDSPNERFPMTLDSGPAAYDAGEPFIISIELEAKDDSGNIVPYHFFFHDGHNIAQYPIEGDKYIIFNEDQIKPMLYYEGTVGYYESDGVNPNQGLGGSSFEFKVKYAHESDKEPAINQLWIDFNVNGSFDDVGEKITMGKEDFYQDDYKTGVTYTATRSIRYDGDGDDIEMEYKFYFSDGTHVAGGNPTNKHILIIKPNGYIPQISWIDEQGAYYNKDDKNICFEVSYLDQGIIAAKKYQLWLDLNQDNIFDRILTFDSATKYNDYWKYTKCISLDVLEKDYGFSGDKLNYELKFANEGNWATGEASGLLSTLSSPLLSWPQDDPNMGVYPQILKNGNTVEFNVIYKDDDNDKPTKNQVHLWADINDDGDTNDNGEIDLYLDMNQTDENNNNYISGAEFKRSWVSDLEGGGYVNYQFIFNDHAQPAISECNVDVDPNDRTIGPADEGNNFLINRPSVLKFEDSNNPDFVWREVVDIDEGHKGYRFFVIYSDIDDHAPSSKDLPYLFIDGNSESYPLKKLDKNDENYKNGCIYSTDPNTEILLLYTNGSGDQDGHRIKFVFNDGYDETVSVKSLEVEPVGKVPTLTLLYTSNESFYDSNSISSYNFKISYTDTDDDTDMDLDIKERIYGRELWIDLNDDGSYNPNTEVFEMKEKDTSDRDITDGKIFYLDKDISYVGDGKIKYKFVFHDGYNLAQGPSNEYILELASIPMLFWSDATGYKTDGINGIFSSSYNFEFRVMYKDKAQNKPKIGQVWIDINNDDIYSNNEKKNMGISSTGTLNWKEGVEYTYKAPISDNIYYDTNNPIYYKFYFKSENSDCVAIAADLSKGDPTAEHLISKVGNVPKLSYINDINYSNGFMHLVGEIYDEYRLKIKYIDQDNNSPGKAEVYLYYDNGSSEILEMNPIDDSDDNYTDGVEYYVSKKINKINDSTEFNLDKYEFVFTDHHNIVTSDSYTPHSLVLNNLSPVIRPIGNLFFNIYDSVQLESIIKRYITDEDMDSLNVSIKLDGVLLDDENKSFPKDYELEKGEHILTITVKDIYGAEDTQQITITVSNNIGTVEGRILDYQNNPIEGAQITVYDNDQIMSITDSNGIFNLNLNVGIYQIQLSADMYDSIVKSNIIIKGDKTYDIGDVKLSSNVGLISGWVKGKTIDGNLIPLEDAKITAVKTSDTTYRRSVYCSKSDDDMAYFRIYLPYGTYNLIISAAGYKSILLTNSNNGYRVNPTIFDKDDPNTYPNYDNNSSLGITLIPSINWRITSYEIDVSKDPNQVENETTIIILPEGEILPDVSSNVFYDSTTEEMNKIGKIGYLEDVSNNNGSNSNSPIYRVRYTDYAGKGSKAKIIVLSIPVEDPLNGMDEYVSYMFDIHPSIKVSNDTAYISTQNVINPYTGGIIGPFGKIDSTIIDNKLDNSSIFDITYVNIPPYAISTTSSSNDTKIVRITRELSMPTNDKQISYTYEINIFDRESVFDPTTKINLTNPITVYMQIDPNSYLGNLPATIEILSRQSDVDEWSSEGISYTKQINDKLIAFQTDHLTMFSTFLIIPTNLKAKVVKNEGISLSWEDNALTEEGYIIQRSEIDSDGNISSIDNLQSENLPLDPNTTSFIDLGVEKGERYRYMVQTITEVGPSPFSDAVEVTYKDKKEDDTSDLGCFINTIWRF